jgi:hypothetical protein
MNEKKDVNALCTNAVGIGRQQEIASKEALSVTFDDELKSLITHKLREASDDTGLNWHSVLQVQSNTE